MGTFDLTLEPEGNSNSAIPRNKQYLIDTLDEISQKMSQVYEELSNASTYPLAEFGIPDPLSVLQRQTLSAFDDVLYKLKMQRLSDTRLLALQAAENAKTEMEELSKNRRI